jgi:hypothetical protein
MLHPWDMLPSSVTDEYGHAGSSTPTPHKRLPWNKGKLTGAKPPLRPKHVWSVWTTFQIEGRARDLTMFNLAIDSKLRGSNLAHERPLCAKSCPWQARNPTSALPPKADSTRKSRHVRKVPTATSPIRLLLRRIGNAATRQDLPGRPNMRVTYHDANEHPRDRPDVRDHVRPRNRFQR